MVALWIANSVTIAWWIKFDLDVRPESSDWVGGYFLGLFAAAIEFFVLAFMFWLAGEIDKAMKGEASTFDASSSSEQPAEPAPDAPPQEPAEQ
jgi:hypothetical protein